MWPNPSPTARLPGFASSGRDPGGGCVGPAGSFLPLWVTSLPGRGTALGLMSPQGRDGASRYVWRTGKPDGTLRFCSKEDRLRDAVALAHPPIRDLSQFPKSGSF